MSDSDSELTNNLFHFQNGSTVASVRGPNIFQNNITGLKFQNNVSSSTMQIPQNFERQRYAESNYDQRSMYRRREASPMSIMSACDMRQRNFNNSYYPRETSSQRSGLYGRSGFSIGARSIGSSASVSAADIAMAFKSRNFNKYELSIINDAYKTYVKHRVRRKIEKRRKLRQFLKGSRYKSGGDSGDQGSDSSLSSDDRSTRTSNYKENISSCRSTKTDILDFRRTIKESNLYKDCTDNFRHSSTRSITGDGANYNRTHTSLSSHRNMIAGSKMPSFRSVPMPPNFNSMQRKPTPALSQKERFKTGFLLPSQRFNRSVASATIQENPHNVNTSNRNNLQNGINTEIYVNRNSATNIETDSDLDDIIFSEATSKINGNTNIRRKRSSDSNDDMNLPNQKRAKVANPYKNSLETKKSASNETSLTFHNNGVTNEFVFAKPTFPVKKSVKEKLISKSAAPKSDNFVQSSIMPSAFVEQAQPEKPVEHEKEDNKDEPSNATQNTTDLSMRPSFIKRKLFTQRLDISEKRKMSGDSSISPQNSIYGAIQKEKHKARKLQQVTTQSCLSRDVQQDGSNLLDLISKVVPIEQMNVTNQTNKTYLQNGTNKTKENEDKWDVTSIISTRNNDEDESETYTDEEIFNATVKELAEKDNSKQSSPITRKQQAANKHVSKNSPIKGKKELVEKPTPGKRIKDAVKENVFKKVPVISLERQKILDEMNDITNKSSRKCLKSFWDTDFESDVEYQPLQGEHNMDLKENREKELIHPKDTTFQGFSSKFNLKSHATTSNTHTSTIVNNTVDSVQKFNSTSLRIRSHRTPKRKKVDQTRNIDSQFDLFENESKKQKTFQPNSHIEPSKTKINIQNIEYKKTVKKQQTTEQDKKQMNTNKKSNEIISQNKKQSPETKNPKKSTVTNNSSRHEATLIEENNISYRAVKSCRNPKKNEILDKPNLALRGTLNKDKEISKERVTKQLSKQVNAKPDKQTSTNKNSAETKSQNKKSSPKPRNNKKNVMKNNISGFNDSSIEEDSNDCSHRPVRSCRNRFKDTSIEQNNNNCSHRPVRSCRNTTKNKTSDKSILTLNGTPNRTLRSRQIDLTLTLNGNITNGKQKVSNHTKDAKSRLSDVSFSLVSEKNIVAKSTVKKTTNSRLFKAKDFETSDVSFSLTSYETPTPKKTISATSRVNLKAGKKLHLNTISKPYNNAALDNKKTFISKNESKSNRVRIPPKRYLMS